MVNNGFSKTNFPYLLLYVILLHLSFKGSFEILNYRIES